MRFPGNRDAKDLQSCLVWQWLPYHFQSKKGKFNKLKDIQRKLPCKLDNSCFHTAREDEASKRNKFCVHKQPWPSIWVQLRRKPNKLVKLRRQKRRTEESETFSPSKKLHFAIELLSFGKFSWSCWSRQRRSGKEGCARVGEFVLCRLAHSWSLLVEDRRCRDWRLPYLGQLDLLVGTLSTNWVNFSVKMCSYNCSI